MDGIKIDVTGNSARVIEKPSRITSGTVGLPAEFTFDSTWEGLRKIAVFRAGDIIKTVDNPELGTIVPWELLVMPNVWLSVGVYGVKADGSVVIPTIWANVSVIQVGVNPDGDPSTDPTLPIWQTMMNYFAKLATKPSAVITEVVLHGQAMIAPILRLSISMELLSIARLTYFLVLSSWQSSTRRMLHLLLRTRTEWSLYMPSETSPLRTIPCKYLLRRWQYENKR